MKQLKLQKKAFKIQADALTPVRIFLQIRDLYPGAIILESADYNNRENQFSYICCEPIARISVTKEKIQTRIGRKKQEFSPKDPKGFLPIIKDFIHQFKSKTLFPDSPFTESGFFGYTAYDCIPFFEDITLSKQTEEYPLMHYQLFRFVLVIDHFKNTLYCIEHTLPGEDKNGLDGIKKQILNSRLPQFSFETMGHEIAAISDETFREMVEKAKKHCHLGDVFQLVLSRKYSQTYLGDAFNVYRTLRALNPSPYLFYFDYGDFSIFGSSPEAQLIVKNNKATINPIAGTYKRSGNAAIDKKNADALLLDKKENAEHVMLVDLARNDLGRNGRDVKVESYREIQYFSHVIHMVSKVSAEINPETSCLDLTASTFPAGTLSGAPKYKAMQLIDTYEKEARGLYGGAIGIIGLDNSFNHAILIRSFLCKNNQLHYQAGAGIVSDSDAESELQEVHNKLNALRNAIQMAQNQLKDEYFISG